MERKGKTEIIKTKLLTGIDFAMNLLVGVEFIIIIELHLIVPFFPVLFLFDLCFVVGYPMFLRYVLKKKWFECTKNNYLNIKYILLPWLIMGLIVLLYYHKETWLALQKIAES
jgi:hypothetical protein